MYKKLYLTLLAAFATAGALVLFAMLAAPVAKPFFLALIIGISTMPHYNRILKWVRGRSVRASGLMILAITICLIIPVAALVISATMSANEWYQQVQQLILSISKTGAGTLSRFPLFGRAAGLAQKFGMDLEGIGAKAASAGSALLLNMAGEAAKNLLDFLFTLAVALFILFFIYRDGERIVDLCIEKTASDKEKAHRYVSQIRSITTAVTVGTIFTCATQGVTAGLGYWVAGVPAPVFCGALTAIAALVPVVGTGVIWAPLVIFIALNGQYLTAILLALWCMIFVGLADNAIRPLAIGAASDIPVLAIVLGAICGVVSMGMLGLILGPVIFAILMSIWGEAIREAKPEAGEPEEAKP
jgi:predicted PurR-regulated permease PerM